MNIYDADPVNGITITEDQMAQLEDLARAVRAASDGPYGTLREAALELAEAVFPADEQAEQDDQGARDARMRAEGYEPAGDGQYKLARMKESE